MSSNNVVWVMNYEGLWHVFYSTCFDNVPEKPDYNGKHYQSFMSKGVASVYANAVVMKIDKECSELGYDGVEYGVCCLPVKDKEVKDLKPLLKRVGDLENKIQSLNEQLIHKENRIKDRLCTLENSVQLKDEVEKLEFPKSPESCEHHKYNTEFPYWECGICGHHSFAHTDIIKNELIVEINDDLDYFWFIIENAGLFDLIMPEDYKKTHTLKKKWEKRLK